MKFTEQQKSQLLMIGFVAAVLMVVVLYFHFVIGRSQVNQFTKQSASLEQEIRETETELAEIRALLAQEDEMEQQRAKIAKVVKRLPSNPDAPGFLMALVSILRTTGIIQEMVKPERPASRTQYTEIPYSINAFGRYHEFGQFLTLIEQNPDRFMRVKGFTLTNNENRPSMHPVDLEVATFMFNR